MNRENRIQMNSKTRFVNRIVQARNWAILNLERLASFLEANSWIPLVSLGTLYLCFTVTLSQCKLLWHDELFTYYISQAPDIGTLVHQTRTLDLNPPLLYLTVRTLFRLVHPSPLLCRMPSILGILICALCVYKIAKSRMGVLWGLAAAIVLVKSPAFAFSIEARPYAISLCFIGLSLLGYQTSIGGKYRHLGILCLLLGCGGALMSHVFSLLAWGVIVLTESYRTLMKRRIDWPVLLALVLPLAAIVLYLPIFQNHVVSVFPPTFQPGIHTARTFYLTLFIGYGKIFSAVVVVALLLLGRRLFTQTGSWAFSREESITYFGFLVTPSVLLIYLMCSHGAFFSRYGFIAYLGVSFLMPAFLFWLTGGNRVVALACIAFLLLGSPLQMGEASWSTIHLAKVVKAGFWSGDWKKLDDCQACSLADKIAPTLPFVNASGLTFIEMDSRRDSKFLSRVYYLTDPAGAMDYAHATIFEGMQKEKESFPIRANVAAYERFVHIHRQFLVYGQYEYPEDWLLRKLLADGAQLRLLGRVGGTYKDHELWEITLSEH